MQYYCLKHNIWYGQGLKEFPDIQDFVLNKKVDTLMKIVHFSNRKSGQGGGGGQNFPQKMPDILPC